MTLLRNLQSAAILMGILVLYINKGDTGQITTIPNQIIIGGMNPTQELRITCVPNAFGIKELHGLEIGKKSFGSNVAIVQILKSKNQVVLLDRTLEQRITYSGSLSAASGNLELRISELECSDAASTYYCYASYNVQSLQHSELTANVTVRSYPENMMMVVTPDNSVYEQLPTSVQLECTGKIGNVFDQNMASFWVWEWRLTDGFSNQWSRYPDSNSINYDNPRRVDQSFDCQYSGRSTLSYTVRAEDNGREFRCYVLRPEYGGNKTIYTQDPGAVSGSNGITLSAWEGTILTGTAVLTQVMLYINCK